MQSDPYEIAIVANITAKFPSVDSCAKVPNLVLYVLLIQNEAHYLEMQRLLYLSIIRGSFTDWFSCSIRGKSPL